MTGRIRYVRGKGKNTVERERLCGLDILTVTQFEPPGLPPRRLERALTRTETVFRKAQVSRVLLPPDYPHRSRLELVRPVDTLSFYRSVADLLALSWLEERGLPARRSRVALAGTRSSPQLWETALRLCQKVWEIRIDVPGEEGERLAGELQREFGLPVVPSGVSADLTLSFSPGGGDLRLWGDEPFLGGLELAAEGTDLPVEYRHQLLALLWERGSVSREHIRVRKAP